MSLARAARVLVELEGEGGCIFVAIFSIAIATVPATFSNELAMLDIPSPAEMRRDLVGSLSCYVLVECSARLELNGYDFVVWHVALEACASSTQ